MLIQSSRRKCSHAHFFNRQLLPSIHLLTVKTLEAKVLMHWNSYSKDRWILQDTGREVEGVNLMMFSVICFVALDKMNVNSISPAYAVNQTVDRTFVLFSIPIQYPSEFVRDPPIAWPNPPTRVDCRRRR